MNNSDSKINEIKIWLGSGSINLFGLPFSGKDTQGEMLANVLGGVLIAGGEILRSYPDQTKIEEIMADGNLLPSELYMDIVLPYLSRTELNNKPLILSSVGRMQGEQQIIMESASRSGHPLKAVVLLELSEDTIYKRFEKAQATHDRGEREDDSRVVLQNRIAKFKEQTLPVIDFYQKNELLIRVDDSKNKEEVELEIIEALHKKATAA